MGVKVTLTLHELEEMITHIHITQARVRVEVRAIMSGIIVSVGDDIVIVGWFYGRLNDIRFGACRTRELRGWREGLVCWVTCVCGRFDPWMFGCPGQGRGRVEVADLGWVPGGDLLARHWLL